MQELEHDPEASPWGDLDAEDNKDPLMVCEYVVGIFSYMKELVSFQHFSCLNH